MKHIVLCALVYCSVAVADEAILQTVDAKGDDANFFATLVFDKETQPQALIDFADEYIQVDLKGQNRTTRREVFKVADDRFSSVIVSQFAPDVVRARIYLNKENKEVKSADFRGQVSASAEANLVKVVVAKGAQPPQASVDEGSEPVDTEAFNEQMPVAEELLAGEMNLAKQMTEKAAKTEAEIPVLTKAQVGKSKSTDLGSRALMSLAVIIISAGGIIMFSRYWAKRKSGLPNHNQIKVLTQYALGPKKSLAIVRVAGESILIGITDQNISMLKSLALLDEEVPTEVPINFNGQLAQSQIAHEMAQTASTSQSQQDSEDFSFGSVRDIVASKLREMRSL